MAVGLVLEGGGMRGLYTAGVLDTFLDAGIKVDGVVSVSAGALFGVNFLSKQKGRALRYNKKYALNPGYMGLRSWLKTGNVVNKEFAYYKVPMELDIFDEEAFEKSGVPFYVTVTNLSTGKAEYHKVDNVFEQMELLRASSALPLASKIVEWQGNKYLDGGLSDSIPVDFAKSLGFDKLIVVLTRPIDYRKKPNVINTITTPLNTLVIWKMKANFLPFAQAKIWKSDDLKPTPTNTKKFTKLVSKIPNQS